MFKEFKWMPMLDADDGLDIGTGGEEPEVAEPVVEEGGEEPEVAEPVRTEADASFAAMRRRAEEAERAIADMRTQNQQMADALGLYFDGETPEDLMIAARSNAYNVDPEIERARFQAEQQLKSVSAENENLKNQLLHTQVERAMEQGLNEVKAIDPTIKDLSELGEHFPTYIAAGLSTVDAYWACKAREAKEKVNPPGPIGTVETASVPSDYYTKEQVEAMTDDELDANWEAIQNSMRKWK